jgi:hypothetical protein
MAELFQERAASYYKHLAQKELEIQRLQDINKKANLEKPASISPSANSASNEKPKRVKLSRDIKEKGYSVVRSHFLDTAAIILSGVRTEREERGVILTKNINKIHL